MFWGAVLTTGVICSKNKMWCYLQGKIDATCALMQRAQDGRKED